MEQLGHFDRLMRGAIFGACAVLASQAAPAQVSEQEAREFAAEAYIYLYPLVLTDLAWRQATNVDTSDRFGFAPANRLQHARCFADVPRKAGERLNPDLLPTQAWIDVGREPVVLSVPQAAERYYFLSLLNQWSEVFLTLGNRTQGGRAGDYALVPPNWRGKLPKELERIEVPTSRLKLVGHTLTKGPGDCVGANGLQDGLKLTLLSNWNKTVKPESKPARFKADPTIDMSMPATDLVKAMSAADFFKYASDLLKTEKTNLSDGTVLLHLRKLGIEPGQRLDFQKLDVNTLLALGGGPAGVEPLIQAQSQAMQRSSGNWFKTANNQGVYGNAYLKRAAATYGAESAVMPEDAIYQVVGADMEGNALNGSQKYTMEIKKGNFPPANAYWSLTLYDEAGNLIANPINRIGFNADSPLRLEKNGSLILYLQKDHPGSQWESNWIPLPDKAGFKLVLRVYYPKPEMLGGTWAPPVVERVKSTFSFGGS